MTHSPLNSRSKHTCLSIFAVICDSGVEFVRAWVAYIFWRKENLGVFLKRTFTLWMIPEVYETHGDSIATINLIWFDCWTLMSDINVVPTDYWGWYYQWFSEIAAFSREINQWGVLGFTRQYRDLPRIPGESPGKNMMCELGGLNWGALKMYGVGVQKLL